MTDAVQDAIAEELADRFDLPRFSSGVTAVYGLSGAGKSSLADTAAEFVAERFGMGTMCIAIDPGGWGNRRLSLIRQGIMRVYDPRNHVNFFETMDLLTLGGFAALLLDADRGYADPNVPIILPRRTIWIAKCPQGHVAAKYEHEAIMVASTATCPTCGVQVSAANQTTERVTARHPMFKGIGLRIFDSLTAMNDQGLVLELPAMSARGELPAGKSGGSALGSADAVVSGNTRYGTGSEAQVGFMQNRTYGWLVNIRTIPDQVLGAIATFGVEQSKDDDTRGGEISYGPAIAGKARTSRVPGWVGNCVHATKEPDGQLQPDGQPRLRHRLWLTNHVDPRDTKRYPYLAKHRGTPLGMPDYLEDPWSDDPAERARLAWSQCSLKRFFELLEQQYQFVSAADEQRFGAVAAKLRAAAASTDDEILAAETPVAGGPNVPVPVTGGRAIGRRGRRPVAAVAAAPAASADAVLPSASSAPAVSESAGSAVTTTPGAAGTEAPSVITQQLQASLAAAGAGAQSLPSTLPKAVDTASTPGTVGPSPAAALTPASTGNGTTTTTPVGVSAVGSASVPLPAVPSTPPAATTAATARPLRRVPRPSAS